MSLLFFFLLLRSTSDVLVGPVFLTTTTAWKHACGYLENYIIATEKVHRAHAKEYEKILKVKSIIGWPLASFLPRDPGLLGRIGANLWR